LLECDAALPAELVSALRGAPGEPGLEQLRELAGGLSTALGVPLPPVAAAPAAAAGVVPAALGAAAAKPLAGLGVWVLGGVALGVGLSGVAAYGSAAFGGPTPAISAPPAVAPAVRAALPSAAPAVTAVPLPAQTSTAQARAPAVVSTTSGAAAAEAATGTLAETELSLLRRARAAVSSNPAEALSLSSRHAERFPRGLLAQEGEVIAIDALVRLGRVDEARARAARFVEHYSGSVHVPRLRELLLRTGAE
jgi:hypothetical protein